MRDDENALAQAREDVFNTLLRIPVVLTMGDLSRLAILAALKVTGGNATQAAHLLRISLPTMRRNLRLMGIANRHERSKVLKDL